MAMDEERRPAAIYIAIRADIGLRLTDVIAIAAKAWRVLEDDAINDWEDKDSVITIKARDGDDLRMMIAETFMSGDWVQILKDHDDQVVGAVIGPIDLERIPLVFASPRWGEIATRGEAQGADDGE